jgi:hypothetical protein
MVLNKAAEVDESFRLMEQLKQKFAARFEHWRDQLSGASGHLSKLEETVRDWRETAKAEPTTFHPRPEAYSEFEREIVPAREALKNVETEIEATRLESGVFGGLLEVNKSLAELYTTVVKNWPEEGFAKYVIYLGTALLGLGSAGFVALGYPTDVRILAPFVLWASGFVVLGIGMASLRSWQSKRMTYFEQRLGVIDRMVKFPPSGRK